MVLETRRWGSASPLSVVCVHGVTQHGGVFANLAERLAAQGHSVLAVDLRGHGESGREPPWNTATHVHDLRETLDAAGVERATWIGHSFGGMVAAALAAEAAGLSQAMVLLDPGLEIPSDRALRSAEIERLDWSFATPDGAVNALLSSESMVAPPRDVVAAFVRDDVQKGPDGRFRFRFSPGAAVVAHSEMALPAPPIAEIPTLLVLPEASLTPRATVQRYEDALGEMLTVAAVPNGHNVLWESPDETFEAVERFLATAAESSAQ
jgi:pimeloyl-ACP methyl ester carboxylesterase